MLADPDTGARPHRLVIQPSLPRLVRSPHEGSSRCSRPALLRAPRVCRHASNYELAARQVKEAMDKKYNENWIVVIGQGFAFEVTHEVKHVLWMYAPLPPS